MIVTLGFLNSGTLMLMKRVSSWWDSRFDHEDCPWPFSSLKNIKIGVWGPEEQCLTREVMVVWNRKGNNGGCSDITSLWCHHWEFWLRLWWHLISIPSEIAQEGLASAKNSSTKKVKSKRSGRGTSTSNEIVQNIHFSSLNAALSGLRVGANLNFFRRKTPHLLTTLCTKWSLNPSRFLSGSTKVWRDLWNWWFVLGRIIRGFL